MSVPFPEQVARAVIERGWNEGDLSAIDEHVAVDYRRHGNVVSCKSAEEFKSRITSVRSAFPDLRIEIHDVISQGERGAVRFNVRGTHRGDFLGLAGTGHPVGVDGMVSILLRDGLLKEEWEVLDTAALLAQLGSQPPSRSRGA